MPKLRKVAGAWRSGSARYRKVAGAWRRVKESYRKVDGRWVKTNADGTVADGDFIADANLIYRQLYMLSVDDWVTYSASDDAVRQSYGLGTNGITVLFRHTEEKTIEKFSAAVATAYSAPTRSVRRVLTIEST